MFKSFMTAVAAIAVFGGPALAAETTPAEETLVAETTGVTADQTGRLVMQDGQAIGTLSEIWTDDNLAVIALMDGGEKKVAISDLVVADDGSIVLAQADTGAETESTYE